MNVSRIRKRRTKANIYWHDATQPAQPEALRVLIKRVLRMGLMRGLAPPDSEISVSLVTEDAMRALNREHRGKDAVTDVLSFPGSLGGLGDIVLCPAVATAQAEEYGHSLEREMAFLAIHGLLHLLGYDHQDEAGEQAMCEEQEKILEALNIVRNGQDGNPVEK
jgi:probable rRNA maturation factor